MIAPERFIARSSDRAGWLQARQQGVTATAVAKAASGPAGFRDQVEARRNPVDIEVNAYMAWGTFMEPTIADWVKSFTHGDGAKCVMPNEWLISHETDGRFLATPDGLSFDGTVISEIKTMGKALEAPPLDHVRQMQWQMFVTGATRCLYAWMKRVQVEDRFESGWIEPRSLWIEKDESMIRQLVEVAEKLIEETK